MILYHITEKRNLKNILKEGLKLGYDKRIFFSESRETALSWINIFREDYQLQKIPFRILAIKVDKFEIIRETPTEKIITEAVSYEPIRPENILDIYTEGEVIKKHKAVLK